MRFKCSTMGRNLAFLSVVGSSVWSETCRAQRICMKRSRDMNSRTPGRSKQKRVDHTSRIEVACRTVFRTR